MLTLLNTTALFIINDYCCSTCFVQALKNPGFLFVISSVNINMHSQSNPQMSGFWKTLDNYIIYSQQQINIVFYVEWHLIQTSPWRAAFAKIQKDYAG